MDKVLQRVVAEIKRKLAAVNVRTDAGAAINYGWQLTGERDGETVKIAVYNGKKGIRFVVQGKESALKKEVEIFCTGEATAVKRVSSTKRASFAPSGADLKPAGADCWIGADESGKGDVFGPLAAAACLVTAAEAAVLRTAGVTDSKLLTDAAVHDMAGKIRDMLGDRAVVTVYMPEEYNRLYGEYRAKGQNLNHLLGDLHGMNIRSLLNKDKCPCIIVDKFGRDDYVLNALGKAAQGRTVIQVPKGERDTAVAAASVLARAAFVRAMDRLEEKYEMSFPKGAFAGIDTALQAFRLTYGDNRLHEVGKLNFRTFDFLR